MIKELTDNNYNEIIEGTDKPIFIDFYSPSCGPCQQLLGMMDYISDYGNDNNVLVLKCDVSKNSKIASKYRIQSVPFTLIVTKDKKIKEPETGIKEQHYYIGLIDKYNPERKGFLSRFFKRN